MLKKIFLGGAIVAASVFSVGAQAVLIDGFDDGLTEPYAVLNDSEENSVEDIDHVKGGWRKITVEKYAHSNSKSATSNVTIGDHGEESTLAFNNDAGAAAKATVQWGGTLSADESNLEAFDTGKGSVFGENFLNLTSNNEDAFVFNILIIGLDIASTDGNGNGNGADSHIDFQLSILDFEGNEFIFQKDLDSSVLEGEFLASFQEFVGEDGSFATLDDFRRVAQITMSLDTDTYQQIDFMIDSLGTCKINPSTGECGTVPEPSSLALFGLGGILLGLRSRRRAQNRKN